MKPREEGVDFLNLDKGQNLILKGIRFKSKGNDSISDGSRERKSDAFETPAFAKHARKGGTEEDPSGGRGSERMTVRMCSRAAESSLRVVGTMLNEERKIEGLSDGRTEDG